MGRLDLRVFGAGEIEDVTALDCLGSGNGARKSSTNTRASSSFSRQSAALLTTAAGFQRKIGRRAAITSSTLLVRVE